MISIGNSTTYHFRVNNTIPGPEIVGWEDWPVFVGSNTTTSIRLAASGTAQGLWVKFIPSCLTEVGPAGVNATLRIGPATSPADYTNTTTLTITAHGLNGFSANTTLTIHQFQALAILDSAGPLIQAQARIDAAYGSGNTSESFGVVYDPQAAGAEPNLTVQFSALGLVENGSLVPIPSWMQVNLPRPFVLNATVPYYFDLYVTTSPPHFGYWTILVQEIENGVAYTDSAQVRTCQEPSIVYCA